ncbi:hypothetical protein JXB01_01590 [Candidatus Micrarchaeota archaeon]|nr:hypothetical protein [Candidatus Micrarchaeota archaeon]
MNSLRTTAPKPKPKNPQRHFEGLISSLKKSPLVDRTISDGIFSAQKSLEKLVGFESVAPLLKCTEQLLEGHKIVLVNFSFLEEVDIHLLRDQIWKDIDKKRVNLDDLNCAKLIIGCSDEMTNVSLTLDLVGFEGIVFYGRGGSSNLLLSFGRHTVLVSPFLSDQLIVSGKDVLTGETRSLEDGFDTGFVVSGNGRERLRYTILPSPEEVISYIKGYTGFMSNIERSMIK